MEEKKVTLIELEKQKIKIDTNNFESLPTKKIKPKLKPQTKMQEIQKTKKSDVIIETKPKLKPSC